MSSGVLLAQALLVSSAYVRVLPVPRHPFIRTMTWSASMTALEPATAISPIYSAPPRKFDTSLYRVEYELLRRIQRIPGLLPISLGVHYSLRPKVVTPALAMIVWLLSLPVGASLITFVCANDLVNTAIKWAVQRPRCAPVRASKFTFSVCMDMQSFCTSCQTHPPCMLQAVLATSELPSQFSRHSVAFSH